MNEELINLYNTLSQDKIFASAFHTADEFVAAATNPATRKDTYDLWVDGTPGAPSFDVFGTQGDPKKKSSPSSANPVAPSNSGSSFGGSQTPRLLGSQSRFTQRVEPTLPTPGFGNPNTGNFFNPPAEPNVTPGNPIVQPNPMLQQDQTPAEPAFPFAQQSEQIPLTEGVVPKQDIVSGDEVVKRMEEERKGLLTASGKTDIELGLAFLTGEGVGLQSTFSYGDQYSTDVITRDTYKNYLVATGMSDDDAEGEVTRIETRYIDYLRDKNRAETLATLYKKHGDMAKAQAEYKTIYDGAGEKMLNEEDSQWLLTKSYRYNELAAKENKGGLSSLTNAEKSELINLRYERSQLGLSKGALYDPKTGTFVSRENATPDQIAGSRKMDALSISYGSTDRDVLRKQRDELFERQAVLEQMLDTQTQRSRGSDMFDLSGVGVDVTHIEEQLTAVRTQLYIINRAYTLNYDPTQTDRIDSRMDMFGSALRAGSLSLVGSQPNPQNISDKDLAGNFVQALKSGGMYVSPTQEAAVEKNLGDLLAEAGGASLPGMVALMMTRGFITQPMAQSALGNLVRSGFTRTMGKNLGTFAFNLVESGAAYTIAGQGFATGAGEQTAQTLFDKLGMDKIGTKALPPVVQPFAQLFLRVAAGTVGETVEEFAGQYTQALSDTGFDWTQSADIAFGKNMDEFTKQLVTIAVMSAMMSTAFNSPQAVGQLMKVREELNKRKAQGQVVADAAEQIDRVIRESQQSGNVNMMADGGLNDPNTPSTPPAPSANAALLEKAKTLSDNIQGMYKPIFESNPEEVLYEAAVQANSSTSEREGAVMVFGEELVNIAQQMYPGAKVGQTFDQYKEENKAKWQVGAQTGRPAPYADVVNGFYSPIENRLLETKAEKQSANKWLTIIGGGDEAIYTGVKAWLKAKAPTEQVSKQDILDFMKENRIEIEEIRKGAGGDIILDSDVAKDQKAIDDFYQRYIGMMTPPLGDKGKRLTEEKRNEIIQSLNTWKEQPTYGNYTIVATLLGRAGFNPTVYEESLYPTESLPPEYSDYQIRGTSFGYREILITKPVTYKYPDTNFTVKSREEYTKDTSNYVVEEKDSGFMIYGKRGERKFYDKSYWIKTGEDAINSYIAEISEIAASVSAEMGGEQVFDFYNQDGNYFQTVMANTKEEAIKQYLENKQAVDVFESGHFQERNILAHLRMNIRLDSDGKRVLFLEEVQSDWGQKGKRDGFDSKKKYKAAKRFKFEIWDRFNRGDIDSKTAKELSAKLQMESGFTEDELISEANKWGDFTSTPGADIPSAPYVTNTNAWVKLALKVALKEAVREGADKIAWTTGDQQNARYDLSKQVDYITKNIDATNEDRSYVDISTTNGFITLIIDNRVEPGKILEVMNQGTSDMVGRNIEDVVGKEVGAKILNGEDGLKLQGDGLKVGGKGMKAFYGDAQNPGIVGNVAKALVKELTGKEGTIVEALVKELTGKEGTIVEAKINDDSAQKNRAIEIARGNDMLSEEQRSTLISSLESAPSTATPQPAIEITPDLISAVRQGMPKFMAGEKVKLPLAEKFQKLLGKLSSVFPGVQIETFDSYDHIVNEQTGETVGDLFERETGTKLETSGGEVYGFLYNGKVYLNMKVMNSETPIHEFAHIWVKVIKANMSSDLYSEGIRLLQEHASDIVEEVRNNPAYANLSEEEILEEALVVAIGRFGSQKYDATLMDWIVNMFKAIARALGIISMDPNQPFNDFLDSAVSEILGEKQIGTAMQNTQAASEFAGQIKYTGNNASASQVLADYNSRLLPGKSIGEVLKEMNRDGYSVARLRSALGDGLVEPHLMEYLLDDIERTQVLTNNFASVISRRDKISDEFGNIALNGKTPVDVVDDLRNQGYSDFEIYNGMIWHGFDGPTVVSIFGENYKDTIGKLIESGKLDDALLAELTADARAVKVSADMRTFADDVNGLSIGDASIIVDYIASTAHTSGFEQSFKVVTDYLREIIRTGGNVSSSTLQQLMDTANVASMLGRCLAMMRGLTNNQNGMLHDAIVKGIEATSAITPYQKSKIKELVDKYLLAKQNWEEVYNEIEELSEKDLVPDHLWTLLARYEGTVEKANQELNAYLHDNFFKPLVSERFMAATSKAMLSPKSTTTGLFGNIELFLMDQGLPLSVANPWRWMKSFVDKAASVMPLYKVRGQEWRTYRASIPSKVDVEFSGDPDFKSNGKEFSVKLNSKINVKLGMVFEIGNSGIQVKVIKINGNLVTFEFAPGSMVLVQSELANTKKLIGTLPTKGMHHMIMFASQQAWGKAYRQINSTLRNGYTVSDTVARKYSEAFFGVNPFRKMAIAHKIYTGAIAKIAGKNFKDLTAEDIANTTGALVRAKQNGELELLIGGSSKAGVRFNLAYQVLDGLLSTFLEAPSEISARMIAVSGDRVGYNYVLYNSLVQQAMAEGIYDEDQIKLYVMRKAMVDQFNENKAAPKLASRQIFTSKASLLFRLISKNILRWRGYSTQRAKALRAERYDPNTKAGEKFSLFTEQLFWEVSALVSYSLSPFTVVPSNVVIQTLRKGILSTSVIAYVWDLIHIGIETKKFNHKYPVGKVLKEGEKVNMKADLENLYYLRQGVYQGLIDVATAALFTMLADAIMEMGAVAPPSGGDRTRDELSKEAGVQPGTLNLTKLREVISGKRNVKDFRVRHGDKLISFPNLGITGLALTIRQARESVFERLGLAAQKRASALNKSQKYAALGLVISDAASSIALLTTYSKIINVLQTDDPMNKDRDMWGQFAASELKIAFGPLAPNIFSFVGRGSGLVPEAVGSYYPDIEKDPDAISRTFARAWTDLSGRIINPNWRSPFYQARIGLFGEEITKPTGKYEPGTLGAYLQAVFDPGNLSVYREDSPKKTAVQNLLMLHILNRELGNPDDLLKEFIFTDANSWRIGTKGPLIEDREFELVMPFDIYRKYLRSLGQNQIAMGILDTLNIQQSVIEKLLVDLDPSMKGTAQYNEASQFVKKITTELVQDSRAARKATITGEAGLERELIDHWKELYKQGRVTPEELAVLRKVFPVDFSE